MGTSLTGPRRVDRTKGETAEAEATSGAAEGGECGEAVSNYTVHRSLGGGGHKGDFFREEELTCVRIHLARASREGGKLQLPWECNFASLSLFAWSDDGETRKCPERGNKTFSPSFPTTSTRCHLREKLLLFSFSSNRLPGLFTLAAKGGNNHSGISSSKGRNKVR